MCHCQHVVVVNEGSSTLEQIKLILHFQNRSLPWPFSKVSFAFVGRTQNSFVYATRLSNSTFVNVRLLRDLIGV